REDPLDHVDAIYVLGGPWALRWLEGADLFREGYAARIVLSPASRDPGEQVLKARGTPIPRPVDFQRQIMIERAHVPADAIEIVPGDVDNTAQEAAAIAPLVTANHWRSLIVITDRSSTRRAGYAMRRALGPDVRIIMRASRYDGYQPGSWWSTRATFRLTFYELPKLLAYWAGLRG
ncbi:MAG: YdcF family protein, partial [Acidobacteria bacterium]